MTDRLFPVRTLTLSAPEEFLNADMIEIRVELIPLRYGYDKSDRSLKVSGERIGAAVCFHRIEARDSRVLFHLVRQLIGELVRHYLNVEL